MNDSGPPSRSRRFGSGFVLIAYSAMTLLMTWPLARVLRTRLAGAGGDTYECLWNLWWVRKAILDPRLSAFHTDYLYYPAGASLSFHTLSFLNGLLSVPLQPVVGLEGAYNLLIMAGFALGAFGAYLAALEVTGSRGAAFLAGFVFGFSPYHTSNALVDLHTATVQFIPLTLWFVSRFRRSSGWKDAAGAGACLALTGLGDWYYLVLTSLAIAVLGTSGWVLDGRKRPGRRVFGQAGLAIAIAALLLSPMLIPLARDLASGTAFENPGGEKEYSADLAAYVVPSSYQPLFRDHLNPFYQRLEGNVFENTVTPGIVVLVLAAIGAAGALRPGNDGGDARRRRMPWIVLGVTALVLSLGPVLQVAGHSVGGGYLPYSWVIERTPFLANLRVPSRFAVLVSLAASVLAAFGARDAVSSSRLARAVARRPRAARWWSRHGLTAVVATAVGLAVFELWAAPFPTTYVPVPAFFTALARDPADYTILGLPTEDWGATLLAMRYQTVHGKRIVNGHLARMTAATRESLAVWNSLPPDHELLIRDRVRFIVFFTPAGVSPWQAEAMRSFDEIPWLHRVDARDASIVVYAVDWTSHQR